MSDVLSQSEIDNLLSALNSGEIDTNEIEEEKHDKKVRKYDFSRPDKFAKDQLRTLEIIHENFSRLLNNFLSGYLRAYTEVEILSVQSLIYSEFSNAISNPSILGIIDFQPLEGQIVMDLSTDIAFSMIERVLGGSGSAFMEVRALTEIEMALITNIIVEFINLLREPWNNIIEIRPKLKAVETNSQFAQVVSPSESVALITFNLHIGDVEGMVNICIPHYVIEPILPNLTSRLWFSNSVKKAVTPEEKEALERGITELGVDVKAVVGSTKLTVLEFLSLRVGDVVVLNKSVNEDFDIFIEKELKFRGRPGALNKKKAIKITESFEKGDELDA